MVPDAAARLTRWVLRAVWRVCIWITYRAYGVDGLNTLFLFLPARLAISQLKTHGARLGAEIELHTPFIIHNSVPESGQHYSNLRIGVGCYLGKEVFLDLADIILIEDRVTISMRVTLLTHTHTGRSPLNDNKLPASHAPVRLCRGCYIGAGAIVLPGITVGEQAIVGAGAVVCHDIAPFSVVAGVPARLIHSSEEGLCLPQ